MGHPSAYPNANKGFPPLPTSTSSEVTAEERSSAVDFVNRVNTLFEEFDHDKMAATFLPDASVHHPYGVYRGSKEMRGFLETKYPPLIPGVSRHATNHVVDRDQETGGVVVRYHNLLIRQVWPSAADKVSADNPVTVTGLPGIWFFSSMVDRLKMTDDGWKVHARIIGSSVINENLGPDAEPRS
ncbi:snoal-like domain-containing [Fusarium albosuccineum]|uniref:Snoal-like domain-containing n=1 Tax=Fusarium albosuccineum TaxID=1237068 RepID=A0A8H4PIK1_9HYPO|nr:snoal-like domain-containing [Fusarium albosuccineum]